MPLLIATVIGALLLAPTTVEPTVTQPPAQPIIFKQAVYGPSWGKYRDLLPDMANACGDQSIYCEVYCPREGMNTNGKSCRIIFGCGATMTRSTEARSGELMILDCRYKTALVGSR